MSSRDLQAVVKAQKAFIKELLDRLMPTSEKSSRILIGSKKFYDIADVQTLLNDRYFIGLTLEQILELAKKSIRLTKDNCDMTHKLEDIREIIEDTEIDYEKTCYLVKDILDK